MVMDRPSKEARRIAYNILGKPANMTKYTRAQKRKREKLNDSALSWRG